MSSLRGRQGYDGIAVAVPVSIPYVRYSTWSSHRWLTRALAELLKQSGLRKDEIDGLCASSFLLAPDTAVTLTQHLGLAPRWIDHIPMGGASAVVALRRAARAVQSGDANVVACIAGDTNHVESFRQMTASFSQFSRDAAYPYGAGGPNMSFALLTDFYMRTYGATREDFGKLCVAQRSNALRYPHALFKKPLTLDEYLNARIVADPLRLFDCVMPCAGAEGFLVLSQERADSLGLASVRILGTIERHNAFSDDAIQSRGGWVLDHSELYEQAGISPAEVSLVQTYDDYPVISMMQLEDLGFCEKGCGPEFVRKHTFTVDGTFPLNTNGGQLSVGQAGAAGGYLGMVEALRQLLDLAGARAVPDAHVALVSGFGMINYDRGLCTGAAILARGRSAA